MTFTVKYHKDPLADSARIVGFEVMPFRLKFLFFMREPYLLPLISLSNGVYFLYFLVNHVDECSVKHEYEGEWTRLTTCDPHANRAVTSSESPQEVEEEKEIIFTYDVEFQVRLCTSS